MKLSLPTEFEWITPLALHFDNLRRKLIQIDEVVARVSVQPINAIGAVSLKIDVTFLKVHGLHMLTKMSQCGTYVLPVEKYVEWYVTSIS